MPHYVSEKMSLKRFSSYSLVNNLSSLSKSKLNRLL